MCDFLADKTIVCAGQDISNISVHGLESASFLDKVTSPPSSRPSTSEALTLAAETDRVYESGKPKFSIVREGLSDCTVWNPWQKGAEGMGDFEPKSGFRNMVCVEPGAVSGWVKLEPGDAWEGEQVIKAESE